MDAMLADGKGDHPSTNCWASAVSFKGVKMGELRWDR